MHNMISGKMEKKFLNFDLKVIVFTCTGCHGNGIYMVRHL